MINITIENRDFVFDTKQISRLWVIGFTGVGKSTFALALSRALGVSILEAGTFAREAFGKDTPFIYITSSKELEAKITQDEWNEFNEKEQKYWNSWAIEDYD